MRNSTDQPLLAKPITNPPLIKTAIIEDQRSIRESLAIFIEGTPGYSCTGGFRTVEEALEKIKFDLPDVVLCDIGLPGMSGIEGIRILKEQYPAIKVLMLTIHDDDDRIFDALCAGASGYLLKRTTPARLLESMREAVTGGAPMSPEVASRVIALFRDIRPPERAAYELTPHEVRLLKMLIDGHNYTTAAAELDVSVNGVKFHMRNIFEKLQVHSKSEAVAKALRDRIIR